MDSYGESDYGTDNDSSNYQKDGESVMFDEEEEVEDESIFVDACQSTKSQDEHVQQQFPHVGINLSQIIDLIF